MTRTIRRLLIGRWRLTGRVSRRFAQPWAAQPRPLLLTARWMRLRVAGRPVRLAVRGAVSVAGAHMAADSPPMARLAVLPCRLLAVSRLWVSCRLLPRPVAGFRVRARQVLVVVLLFLCCLVCRLVVCRVFRRLRPLPVALRLVLPCLPLVVWVLFPRCRRTAWPLAVPTVAFLFVAVCAGNARLSAIGCC